MYSSPGSTGSTTKISPSAKNRPTLMVIKRNTLYKQQNDNLCKNCWDNFYLGISRWILIPAGAVEGNEILNRLLFSFE